MRVRYDEHLSPRLVRRLADQFPDSTHVQLAGLRGAPDRVLWNFARENGYVLVSRDGDFERLSMELGAPPKVIIVRVAAGQTALIEQVLRAHAVSIERFGGTEEVSVLFVGQ